MGTVSKSKKGKRRKNRFARKVGISMGLLQAFATLAFLAVLLLLNMLPVKYLAAIGGVLALALFITFASQLMSRKKGIAGKLFSGFMTLVLLFATFNISKANSAIGNITTDRSYKLDSMVVAVKSEDSAENIQEAKNYVFGVQYAMGGEDVRTMIDEINRDTGANIQVQEYAGLSEQAQAFHDGEVQAIIYNEGYTGILQETFEGYSQNVKIIYNHSIKKEIAVVDNRGQQVDVKNDTFSVYISGIDVYGEISTNSRSDVNIVATVNPTTHQILLITTPRDYYVEIPDVTGGQKDKLTHAGIYGVDASMRALDNLYNMNLDFYARVNFTSLIDIVDNLGGVDVESELAFTTSEDSGYVMDVEQGMNHFDGKQALAFSRERQNLADGDNQRGKNQQAVITALIRKMLSPAMLLNAGSLMDSVSSNVETNMPQNKIQDLIKSQLSKGGSWNIKSMSAEGTGDTQYCYSYAGAPLYVTQPDQASVDAIEAAVAAVANGEILPDSKVAE